MENIEKYPSINNLKDLKSYLNLILNIDTTVENQIWMNNDFIDTNKIDIEDIKKSLYEDLKHQIGNIRITTKHSKIPLDNIKSLDALYGKIMLWIRLVVLTSTYDVKIAVISYDNDYVSMQMIITGNFKSIEKIKLNIIKENTIYDKTNDLIIEEKIMNGIDNSTIIIIALVLAVLYTAIRFIRDFKREVDIKNGMDVKEATKYYNKFFHKKDEKEDYNIKTGRIKNNKMKE